MKFVDLAGNPIQGTAYLFSSPGKAKIKAPLKFTLDDSGTIPDAALPKDSTQVLQVFKDGKPVTKPIPSYLVRKAG